MQEGYDRPSFGFYATRVLSIVIAVVLFGFIIWGLFRLAEDSSFWSAVVWILVLVIGIAAALFVIGFIFRLIRASAIGKL